MTNKSTTKRIKRVFSNGNEVLHRWANQTQDEARCPNVFFKGKSVYSYGYHYELGRLVQFRGHTVALINDTGYSSTTSKHICYALRAVSHMPTLRLKGFSGTPAEMVKTALLRAQGELLDRLFDHFSGRRFWTEAKWEKTDSSDGKAVQDFNVLCSTLGFQQFRLEVNAEYISAYNAHIQACLARKAATDAAYNSPEELAKRAAAAAAQQAELLEKQRATIEAWKRGERTNLPHGIRPMLLRISDGMVETSGGASAPLADVRRLLFAVETGTIRKGDKVGEYTFDSMSGGILKIGCHDIRIEELRAVLGAALTLVPTSVGGAE